MKLDSPFHASNLLSSASSAVPACWHTWVEIEAAALLHNVHVAKKRAPHAKIIAVLKANAYGHGMEEVAKVLASEISFFAVASYEEGLRLQQVVPHIPVMLLSAALPCEYSLIGQKKMIPTISSYEEASAFADVVFPGSPIHVKIDTGMGRLGIPAALASKEVHKIAQLPLTIQSFSTHFSSADSNLEETQKQLAIFKKLLPSLQKAAPKAIIHTLNSAGLFHFAQPSDQSVRMGLMLYGVSPMPDFCQLLKPALTWKARVSLIRKIAQGESVSYGKTYVAPHDLLVGVISVGYADGYPWQLSNQGCYVLLHGCQCPILGRITMDQMIIDISEVGKVCVGDEVVLLGKQGTQEISAPWLASKANTIPWHLFTGIGQRVHRVIIE